MNRPETVISAITPIKPQRRVWHELPMGVFYIPVFFWILWLMVRHRSLNAPLCANWALPNGGLYPGSKDVFAKQLGNSSGLLPRSRLLVDGLDLAAAKLIFTKLKSAVPKGTKFVLKPDDGIQGRSIHIFETQDEFDQLWRDNGKGHGNWLLQEFVDGFEAAIFYVRENPALPGRFVSMSWKQGFEITGDGHSTIGALINAADSDKATAGRVAKFNAAQIARIPASGQKIDLMPVRNHHLGATFQDISSAITPQLEATICPALDVLDGYNFGRLDVRAPSAKDLLAGKNIKILEANGLYSEPVHAYDPKYGLFDAYRIFFASWVLAFRCGLAQKKGGKPQISFWKAIMNTK